MRYLLVTLTLVALLAAPAAGQSGQAESTTQATVIFYTAMPSAGGRVVATTSIDAAASADLEQARYANLRVRTASFVFAVARIAARGQAVGETLVRLNGGARTLADIAADLQAGLSGSAAVLVFTKVSGKERAQSGEAVAVVHASRITASTRVDISGATHMTLVAEGQVQSFTIVRSGTTLGAIQVQASSETQTSIGAAAGGGVSTIVEVLGQIGIKIGN
ncbi:MAG: hypothetical protein ACRDFT_07740 [bacterium]